jgi:hypothetical protein
MLDVFPFGPSTGGRNEPHALRRAPTGDLDRSSSNESLTIRPKQRKGKEGPPFGRKIALFYLLFVKEPFFQRGMGISNTFFGVYGSE